MRKTAVVLGEDLSFPEGSREVECAISGLFGEEPRLKSRGGKKGQLQKTWIVGLLFARGYDS